MRFGEVQVLVKELAHHGVSTWVFGGWAEEIHGLSPPRAHKDLDLLYPAPDFAALDAFIRASEVREYAVKHSLCSRAFDRDGEFVEFYLVLSDAHGHFTDFWGYVHQWPLDTFADTGECPAASAASLASARSVWTQVERAYDAYAADQDAGSP